MRVGLFVSVVGLLVLAGCTQVQPQTESAANVGEDPPKTDSPLAESLCPVPPPCPVCKAPAIMCP